VPCGFAARLYRPRAKRISAWFSFALVPLAFPCGLLCPCAKRFSVWFSFALMPLASPIGFVRPVCCYAIATSLLCHRAARFSGRFPKQKQRVSQLAASQKAFCNEKKMKILSAGILLPD